MPQQFTVLLFGALRDMNGADCLEIVIETPTPTVAEVLRACVIACPKLGKWTNYLRVAVNCEYVEGDFVVSVNDEIALLPPVAGG